MPYNAKMSDVLALHVVIDLRDDLVERLKAVPAGKESQRIVEWMEALDVACDALEAMRRDAFRRLRVLNGKPLTDAEEDAVNETADKLRHGGES